MQTRYSEYHILDDCETSDIKNWIALKDEAENPIILNMGDVLIHSK